MLGDTDILILGSFKFVKNNVYIEEFSYLGFESSNTRKFLEVSHPISTSQFPKYRLVPEP